jgi:hypothetical protein
MQSTHMSRKRFLATGTAALAGVATLPLFGSRRAAAAAVAAAVECDSMTRSWGSGIWVISDINADNGKALHYTARGGTAKTGVSFSTSADTVRLRLRTIKDSVWPDVSVLIDGVQVAAKVAVASSAYTVLSWTLASPISQGTHKVEVAAFGGMGGNEAVIADWIRFENTTSTAPPPAPIAFGISAGNDQWGTTSRIDAYRSLVGIEPKIIHAFQPFKGSGGSYVQVGGSGLQALYNKYPQAAIMVSWEPRQLGSVTALTTAQIANGNHDAYITQQAQRLAANGKRLILRFGHEMNIDQFPWGSLSGNATKVASYKVAWQRTYDIFAANGANQFVEWCFCPNMRAPVSPNASAFSLWYPGDSYVDWTGVDCYNWSTVKNMPWYTPSQLYSQSLTELNSLTFSKGHIIGETGCDDTAPSTTSKAEWFTQMHDYFLNATEAQRVKGIAYLHNNIDGAQWRVDYPAAALPSYKEMLSDPSFQAVL